MRTCDLSAAKSTDQLNKHNKGIVCAALCLFATAFLSATVILMCFTNTVLSFFFLRPQNMRVRTVKGQPYVCRTGAKFHGAMLQRFLLVDCHTAIYGSYR